ncbi:MAG: PqqD family protein [Clostridia bacterium]|nr:PqqD family protein [Clostridia bacterium]
MKYKVKDCFEMKQIADEYIVIPRGSQALDFNATVVFNESGAFLWNYLKEYNTPEVLAAALKERYAIEESTAAEDTRAFLNKMEENGMLDTAE